MTAIVEQNQSKPWEKEQIPFNLWYRKRLRGDFSTIINTVNLTREIIKNGGSEDDMYLTFLANLQEAQVRLTQLLFELEEKDMELALKINDSICSTMDWAKKSKVSSLLPSIPDTAEVTTLVDNMLEMKQNRIESTDEKKVEDQIAIELQVGVGATSMSRHMLVPRGTTLTELKNVVSNLKKREHVTFVKEGLKVEHTTVLINGDNIIAVVTSAEGPFEGFDDEEKAKPVPLIPISPPPSQDKKIQEADIEIDLLTSDLPARGIATEPLAIFNEDVSQPVDTVFNDAGSRPEEIVFDDILPKPVDTGNVDTSINAEVGEESNNNPFDPISEPPKPAASANPFDESEVNEEEPLITFERFSLCDNPDAVKEAKENKEPTEKDNLLDDTIPAEKAGELANQESFPKFTGFS